LSSVSLREALQPGAVPRFELEEWRRDFGIVAGITGRGGASEPFDLGLWSHTPVITAMSRWRTFRTSIPGFDACILGMQVHGTRVAWQTNPAGWLLLEGIDGHATGSAGVLLTVTVADCVPVYLIDPAARRIALLHAGWRGTAAGIIRAGVEMLQAHGSAPGDLLMRCGVAICGRCYEVGSEVFEALDLPSPKADGRGLVDLRTVLERQGRALGVSRISISDRCSAHDSTDFFSHRASRGADGRMVAYLGVLP
jgi:YfiH family protein